MTSAFRAEHEWGCSLTGPAGAVAEGDSESWCLIWGVVDSPATRNDVDETQDATAPATRKTRERSFAFGLSFNLAVVTTIFK